jgi:hypothetical protein
MVKKALLIGINYIGSKYELSGCINDIKNLKLFFIENCNYQEDNIVILSEEDEIKPTMENIKNKIMWLISNNKPDDTLVFHYSGHGSNIEDNNKDETDKKDETIVPLDFETKGDITDDWLFENMVSKIEENVNLYCFFDCCHSGTIIDLKYNYRSKCKPKVSKKKIINYDTSQWSDSFIFDIERSNEVKGNVIMLSGCEDRETSADAVIQNKDQGAFTFCLIETLKNNLESLDDGSKIFKNKLRNVLKEINCRLDINKFRQNSQLSLSKKEFFEQKFNL